MLTAARNLLRRVFQGGALLSLMQDQRDLLLAQLRSKDALLFATISFRDLRPLVP